MQLSHELALSLLQSEDFFPVDLDDAWEWLGYSTKQKAKNKLTNNFAIEVDYTSFTQTVKRGVGGTTLEVFLLTIEAFKSLGMMAGTTKGREVRRYFIECERQLKAATQNNKLRELELQVALSQAQSDVYREQRRLGEFNQVLLQLHGESTLALIQGRPEAVAERFTEVVKTVICTERGTPLARFEGISKAVMARRYGMKKAAHFEAWLESLGKKDFLVQGFTAVPCEYLLREHIPELDKMWSSQQGERQLLIGE